MQAPGKRRTIRDGRPAAAGPGFRAGLVLVLWLLVAGGAEAAPLGSVRGRVLDQATGEAVPGAVVRLQRPAGDPREISGLAETDGRFALTGVGTGTWTLQVEAMGYAVERRPLTLGEDGAEVEVRLQVLPLLMEGMVVRGRRTDGDPRSPAFVEVIPVQAATAGVSLPELLDQAVGVKVRRNGGLGGFSTVSIRGSTAEQVQVYLDGVPLNQALGGAVNVGDLPVTGVESVEVYRGAVPASLGGNSIGGVVQIRTRPAGSGSQARISGMTGSFGTRELGGSASGSWSSRTRYLAVADYLESRNDFHFRDDNGTEYNPDDDEWVERANSDYRSVRFLGKVEQRRAGTRWEIHDTFDLSRQGIPGIGNNQALRVRAGSLRNILETEFSGVIARLGGFGYRLGGYQLYSRESYQDPEGEVGTGIQDTRNTTATVGLRTELDLLLPRAALLTVATRALRETFRPRDLLERETRLFDSRRHSGTAAADLQLPLGDDRLQLNLGSQVTVDDDRRYSEPDLNPAARRVRRDHRETLWGRHLGARCRLLGPWSARGHVAWYQRGPSFFELFGDRGAVIGNTELTSEHGQSGDLGLTFQADPATDSRLELLEVTWYRSAVRDLIRFIQNSQRVSRPYNIGRARIAGMESRVQLRPCPGVNLGGSYVYQRAIDRSPFSYHRGRDLPNAPRHVVGGHLRLGRGIARLWYEMEHESRHYLDRANLRPVAARLTQGAGLGLRIRSSTELSLEMRNLTDHQGADLWGYPLPGRAWYLSLRQEFNTQPKGGDRP